ncbi:hypothetical protein ACNKHK_15325 [Shigella flexneri]
MVFRRAFTGQEASLQHDLNKHVQAHRATLRSVVSRDEVKILLPGCSRALPLAPALAC